MGQLNEGENKGFDAKRYTQKNPGLTEREVIQIKKIFDSLHPENGYVEVDDLNDLFSNSLEYKNQIKQKFGDKLMVDFNDFFDVMGPVMIEKKDRFKDIEFDSNVKNVSCFYCPYSVDNGKNSLSNQRR